MDPLARLFARLFARTAHSFALTAHSFAGSALLASLAPLCSLGWLCPARFARALPRTYSLAPLRALVRSLTPELVGK